MLKIIAFRALLLLVDRVFLKIVRELVDAADINNYQTIPATETSPEVSPNEQRRLAVKQELALIKKEYGSLKNISNTIIGIIIDAVVDKKRKEEKGIFN